MKIKQSIILSGFILIFQIHLFAQIPDLTELIKQTQMVSEQTTSQALFEFSYDFKNTVKKTAEKESVKNYESVCAEKHCEYILVEEDGKVFSEKETAQDRQKAAAKLQKSENYSKPDFFLSRKFIVPLDFISFDVSGKYGNILRKNPYFNPNFYLKNCKINFVDNSLLENRQTVKVSATNCIDESSTGKKNKGFNPPKTEALIWIDEKDKAVSKLEIYGENELRKINENPKPSVILEAKLVPEGFWFWKTTTVNTDNKTIFSKIFGNWKTEFYNYKKFNVEIKKAEVDKN